MTNKPSQGTVCRAESKLKKLLYKKNDGEGIERVILKGSGQQIKTTLFG